MNIFIKMFNLTAVIGADRVEESVVISDHRKTENKWEEELDRVEIIHCHHILHVNKQADSLLLVIVLVHLMQIMRLWKELMLHNSSCVCGMQEPFETKTSWLIFLEQMS